MLEQEFSERLTKLRLKKGVSARDMSLTLGQSESYINRIESQKMLPSMSVFFISAITLESPQRNFSPRRKRRIWRFRRLWPN